MADRISQIAMTAPRVTPTEVGVWGLTTGTGPSTSVVVAQADLAYLIDLARRARAAEKTIARREEDLLDIHTFLEDFGTLGQNDQAIWEFLSAGTPLPKREEASWHYWGDRP